MKHTSICLAALVIAGCTTKTAEAPAKKSAPSLGSSVSHSAADASDREKPAAGTLKESVEYYDGTTPRKLWLSEELIAEFEPSDAGRDGILRADPAAREVEQPQASVRIWRLAGAQRGEVFAKSVGGSALRLSPVLHDGPSPGLPMHALPGGVVVTFPPGWDRAHIDTWLTARSLHVQGDAVVAEANMFLVATAPGLEALKIASELRETGELADVAPNLWRQNATR
jgi:hypothetical protein